MKDEGRKGRKEGRKPLTHSFFLGSIGQYCSNALSPFSLLCFDSRLFMQLFLSLFLGMHDFPSLSPFPRSVSVFPAIICRSLRENGAASADCDRSSCVSSSL